MGCGVENSVPHAVEVRYNKIVWPKIKGSRANAAQKNKGNANATPGTEAAMALHSSNVNRPEEERP